MLRDLIAQTVVPPGTNTSVTLGTALTGFRAFSATGAFANGAAVFYYLTDNSQVEWGTATLVTGSPDTLTNRTPIGNNAGNTARLNFTSASTYCYNAMPALKVVYQDANGNASIAGALTVGGAVSATGAITSAGGIGSGSIGFYIADGALALHLALSGSSGISRILDHQNAGYIQILNQAGSVEWGRIVGGLGWTGLNNVPIVSAIDTGGAGQELIRMDASNVGTLRVPATGTGWRIVDHAFARELWKCSDFGAVTQQSFNVNGYLWTESGSGVDTTGIILNLSRTTSNYMIFQAGGGTAGTIKPNGTGGVSYNQTSDYRLKRSFGESDGALADRIPVHDGAWLAALDSRMPLVFAHEVALHAPFAVDGEKDAVDEDGAMIPQQVDYTKLVPALLARLQHRGKEIDEMKRQMISLLDVVADLYRRIAEHG